MIKISIDRQVMQNVMSGVADQLKSKIDLNLNHVRKLCKERYGIDTIVGVETKDANLVVFKKQIACKLDFEVRFPMSVLITTKENSEHTLPENDGTQADVDDLPEELDEITEELDDLMAEDLEDIPDELDMSELEEEHLIDKD